MLHLLQNDGLCTDISDWLRSLQFMADRRLLFAHAQLPPLAELPEQFAGNGSAVSTAAHVDNDACQQQVRLMAGLHCYQRLRAFRRARGCGATGQ